MLARNAETLRPDSLMLFQSSAGGRQHKENVLSVQSSAGASNVGLYRLASIAGAGGALILLVNAAKRSGLIATSDLTQLLAPLAEILALGFIVGLFLAVGRRSGLFGTIAFVINFIALASLEG